jgi:6-pyruvoyl-tetrahydropterin synthase related domain
MNRFEWKPLARRISGPVIILLAAALATAPLRINGYSCGHDFDFHLANWFDAFASWQRGLFYPHWTASPDYGAGEPRFVFYPPLTWMLGAALHLRMNWIFVPAALVFLMLAGTGLGTRALALELLEDGPATVAGCVAIFSGYSLFTAYERTAFGELTGGFWIPLLLLFALRVRSPAGNLTERTFDGSVAPLALVVGGMWLSNVPLGVMGCYLLAAAALVAALLRKSWAPVMRAAAGAALGIGLASIYLVPATWEQRWVDEAQATNDPGSRIEASWMFARHSDPSMDMHDAVLLKVSIIAASMLLIAFAGLLVAALRGRLKARRDLWIVLALIPAVILLLQFPVSLPIWNLLPKLRLLQFPWRWMVTLEAPMGIFFATALWPAKLWRRVLFAIVCIALFVGATLFASRNFSQLCDADDSIPGMWNVYRSGAGFEGYNEYAPPDADNSLLASGLPGACLVENPQQKLGAPSEDSDNPEWDPSQHSCEATFPAAWTAPEHLHLSASASHAGYLILRLRSYPAWRVTVNGALAAKLPERDDGLIVVPVAPGAANVDVRWTITGDVVAGRWLSSAAVVLFALVCLWEWKLRRPARPRLS